MWEELVQSKFIRRRRVGERLRPSLGRLKI